MINTSATEKDSFNIRDVHEIGNSDLSKIEKNIHEILNAVYIWPYKNITLLDKWMAKKKWNKLIQAGIPLQFYENYSVLEENWVDRVSKIFYVNDIPCGIISYKITLQKEAKYLDMLASNNFKTKNWYLELKSFFVFEKHTQQWLWTKMMKEIFDFFKFTLGSYDWVLMTVNKKQVEYAYNFFIKNWFVDIGSERNLKVDSIKEKTEHVLYFPKKIS